MTRRFWVGLVLTIPVLAIAMSDMIPGLSVHQLLSASLANWVQLALATPVVLWGGWPFFKRGWHRSTAMLNRKRFASLGIAPLLIAGIAYLGTNAPAVAGEETGDSLTSQIRELRAKVARLEAALEENHQGRATPPEETRTAGHDREMGMMKGQGEGMMGDKKMGMMGHKPEGIKGGMGMAMMGRMKGADQESSDFVLPAFPGTAEIYHIGSTEFFLDLAEKINLTADQRDSLEKIKTKSFADASELQAPKSRILRDGERVRGLK